MTGRKPYQATPDELRAIDEARAQDIWEPDPLPDPGDTAGHYRLQAAHLRRRADTAETIEMRAMLLEGAGRLEEMAEHLGRD